MILTAIMAGTFIPIAMTIMKTTHLFSCNKTVELM
jgi:hypothetical protein